MTENNNSVVLMPIKTTAFEHQLQAYTFTCKLFGLLPSDFHSRGVALLMEQGCGKTITSVAISGALFYARKITKICIVAPLSILSVWKDEFQRFADFPYTLTVLRGNRKKKREQLRNLANEGLQIAVVNYESAWRMEKDIIAWGPDLIIADEAHKMKEARTNQSKGMHSIGAHASYRLLLTGTVINNKELDIFSQYKFVEPQIFGTSFFTFRNRYFDMGGYGGHIPIFKQSMKDDFLKRMHAIAFRVTKAECLDLPEITEEVRRIELEPKAQKIYNELEKESYTELSSSEVSAVNVLTKLLRLCQVTGGHLTDDDGDSNLVSTAKLNALTDIVEASVEDNKKIVVMARFIPELNDIQQMLDKKGIGYAVIRGGTKDREAQIRRFQEEPDCMVFVGQIAAAGLGLTLTAASTMCFYSLDYSMSNFEQAKARIHRISQKENCHYIYLVAKNTVDVKVLRALRNKVNLAKSLVDDYRAGRNPYKED